MEVTNDWEKSVPGGCKKPGKGPPGCATKWVPSKSTDNKTLPVAVQYCYPKARTHELHQSISAAVQADTLGKFAQRAMKVFHERRFTDDVKDRCTTSETERTPDYFMLCADEALAHDDDGTPDGNLAIRNSCCAWTVEMYRGFAIEKFLNAEDVVVHYSGVNDYNELIGCVIVFQGRDPMGKMRDIKLPNAWEYVDIIDYSDFTIDGPAPNPAAKLFLLLSNVFDDHNPHQ
jgi:hypothetical protein